MPRTQVTPSTHCAHTSRTPPTSRAGVRAEGVSGGDWRGGVPAHGVGGCRDHPAMGRSPSAWERVLHGNRKRAELSVRIEEPVQIIYRVAVPDRSGSPFCSCRLSPHASDLCKPEETLQFMGFARPLRYHKSVRHRKNTQPTATRSAGPTLLETSNLGNGHPQLSGMGSPQQRRHTLPVPPAYGHVPMRHRWHDGAESVYGLP